MQNLPMNKSEAFEDGVLTRAQGYGKTFNPFRNKNNQELYVEWLKGWAKQNIIMKE